MATFLDGIEFLRVYCGNCSPRERPFLLPSPSRRNVKREIQTRLASLEIAEITEPRKEGATKIVPLSNSEIFTPLRPQRDYPMFVGITTEEAIKRMR